MLGNKLNQKAAFYDQNDPIGGYVNEFHKRVGFNPQEGGSLGSMPKNFYEKFITEADTWKIHGHHGHFEGDNKTKWKWWQFAEQFQDLLGNIMDANQLIPEAGVTNTLTINLNILLPYFLRMQSEKIGKPLKIATLNEAFVSDHQAVKWANYLVNGSNPARSPVFIPGKNGKIATTEEIIEQLDTHKDIGILLVPCINYKTGERLDLKTLARECHKRNILIGVDYAHGIGNIMITPNSDEIDFAVWCNYKYLNSGPGSIGGMFVAEKYLKEVLFGLSVLVPGWWGLKGTTKFGHHDKYEMAEGIYRLFSSNDTIFNSIGIMSSLELINSYGFDNILGKHQKISSFMYECLSTIDGVQIITPQAWSERGCQISFKIDGKDEDAIGDFVGRLGNEHAVGCERRFDVIRVMPCGTNTYMEAFEAANAVSILLN